MAPAKEEAAAEDLLQRFWASGVTDPLTAIEQISYLLLLRTLDLRATRSPGGTAALAFADRRMLRWERLQSLPADAALELLERELIPLLTMAVSSNDFTRAMRGASLALPKGRLVEDCFAFVDGLGLTREDQDPGAVYDVFLDGLLLLGGLSGQVRTPPELVAAMVDLAAPEPGEIVCDPAAGTGALLAAVQSRLGSEAGDLLGYDVNASIVRLGLINLVMHGATEPKLAAVDALSRAFRWPAVDVVVSHPPFGGTLDRRDVHPGLELDSNRADVLFLELCRRMLRPRGRAVVLVPEGVLFGRSRAIVEGRRRWLTQCRVEAVVSLPPWVLQPTTNVKTAILLLSADGRTERVWFGEIDGKRQRPAEPDQASAELRHLAAAVKSRLGDDRGLTPAAQALADGMRSVSLEKIGESGWSLSPSSYGDLEAEPPKDEDPVELLERADALERQIQHEIAAAMALLENRR